MKSQASNTDKLSAKLKLIFICKVEIYVCKEEIFFVLKKFYYYNLKSNLVIYLLHYSSVKIIKNMLGIK